MIVFLILAYLSVGNLFFLYLFISIIFFCFVVNKIRKKRVIQQQIVLNENKVSGQMHVYQSKPLNKSIHREDFVYQSTSLPSQSIKPISSVKLTQSIQSSSARKPRFTLQQSKREKSLVATCSYCGAEVYYRRNPFIRELYTCPICRRKGHIKYIKGKAILRM